VMKRPVAAIMLSFLIISNAISASTTETSHDNAWLADLTHLPSREEIEVLSKHVDNIMQHEKQKTCKAINPRLRKMIFLHFVTYQHMINQRSIYLSEKNIQHWAHVLGMLLKESSGDTTSITSMTGRSYTNYDAKSDLKRWREVTKLSKTGKIPLNYQTNFGLTQLSADRLFVALHLAGDPAYLEGKKKTDFNTAIAVRKLIWFYQDFAQGRLTQAHDRIHTHEQGNPEYAARFTSGASMALLLCGTNYMFYEGYHGKETGAADLTKAMTSIAYCKLGDSTKGYGINEANEICFAEWVTLCPTLNFDIAMLTPLKYFATRNAAPVCEDTFKALVIKKPTPHKKETTKESTPEPKILKALQKNPPGSRVRTILDAVKSLLKDVLTDSDSSPK
jgi:hypothetical protein